MSLFARRVGVALLLAAIPFAVAFADSLLLETGDFLLLETGDTLLLDSPTPGSVSGRVTLSPLGTRSGTRQMEQGAAP